ncbi:MAG: carboxylesterase family protein, partial [Bacteroidetes bacterium]|nr:carboxylesterase family protein [Bacteroidota bacterium]
MKTSVLLLLVLFLPNVHSLFAQNCQPGTYRIPQYGVQGDSNVVYATALNYVLDTVDLEMDVFTPVGDNNNMRPLVIWVHGGGFYAGNRAGMYNFCDQFTQRGYVTATITYRLGYYREHNSLWGQYNYPYPHDQAELSRAMFRAMQDAKAAIRYLKGHASQYGIDTSQVFIGGESAGGFVALQTAFLDKPIEVPPGVDSINNVQYFDLIGQVIFNRERPSLGTIEGDQNLNGTSSKVKGLINIYGGIQSDSLIESKDDPSVFNFHILQDPIVYCGGAKAFHLSSNYVFPFGGIKAPVVYGSCVIKDRLDYLGYCPERHQTWLVNPTSNITPHSLNNIFPQVVDTVAAFLDKQICPDCSTSPIITLQPDSILACTGDSIGIAVSATSPCIDYQWFKDGILIPGATGNAIGTDSAQAIYEGIYQVEVNSFCGTEMSVSALVQIDQPIDILQQPSSMVLCEGDPLEVMTVTNSPQASFQWLKDGIPLNGAVNDTLSFASVSLGDSGNYACVISNGCGVDTTNWGLIQVQPITEILSQPQGATVCAGDPAILGITTKGTNLTFQWYQDGLPIAGATSDTLLLPSVQTQHAGMYQVEVNSLCGADTSILVQIQVIPQIEIYQQPNSTVLCEGDPLEVLTVTNSPQASFQWLKNGIPLSGA